MGGFIVIMTFWVSAFVLFFIQFFVPARWETRVFILANVLCVIIILARTFATALGYESPLGENGWEVKEKNYPREALHFFLLASWSLILPIILGTLLGTLAQRAIVAFVRYLLAMFK